MGLSYETPLYADGVVTLTGYGEDDVAAHLAGEDEEMARRFGWWPKRSTPETVVAAYHSWAEDWVADGSSRTFAARDGTGALLGGCQLQRHEEGPWTVSYWTGAAHRGQGVATRALQLLLSHADREGITDVECHVAEDNAASRRVAEAAGFTDPVVTVEPDGQVMVRYRMRRDVHRRPADREPRPAP